ncbi:hypothetical protein FRB91_000396 [Serendipita sp. 411]|nr:hypothetical protein FRB91_000396 [Serendipita sp. 411]
MFTTSIRNVLIGLVLSFTVGTSALVVTNFERDPVVHRRHAHANANANANDGAAAIIDLIVRAPVPVPVPVSEPMSPRMSMSLARRRELRQKRCVAHLQGANSSSSSSSSSTPAAPTDAPVNAAPAPNNDQPTSSSQAEQPAPAPASNSGGGSGTFTGELTYYDTGLGACGRTNTNSDMIAAASMLLFDGFEGYTGGNPNNNPICGRRVNIYFEGKSINVELTDRCVGCAKYDLDLSPTAFQMLANMDRGRVSGATWSWA